MVERPSEDELERLSDVPQLQRHSLVPQYQPVVGAQLEVHQSVREGGDVETRQQAPVSHQSVQSDYASHFRVPTSIQSQRCIANSAPATPRTKDSSSLDTCRRLQVRRDATDITQQGCRPAHDIAARLLPYSVAPLYGSL